MSAWLAIATAVLVVSLRAEQRAGMSHADRDVGEASLVLVPGAGLETESRRLRVALKYHPRLRVDEMAGRDHFEALHRGSFVLSHRTSRRVYWQLNASGDLGEQEAGRGLGGGASELPDAAQADVPDFPEGGISDAAPISVRSMTAGRTSGGLLLRASRRWSLRLGSYAGYLGDHRTHEVLGRQWWYGGTLGAVHHLTPNGTLSLDGGAERLISDRASDHLLFTALVGGGWDDRSVRWTARAGPSVDVTEATGERPHSWRPLPHARVAIALPPSFSGGQCGLRSAAAIAPQRDPITQTLGTGAFGSLAMLCPIPDDRAFELGTIAGVPLGAQRVRQNERSESYSVSSRAHVTWFAHRHQVETGFQLDVRGPGGSLPRTYYRLLFFVAFAADSSAERADRLRAWR